VINIVLVAARPSPR